MVGGEDGDQTERWAESSDTRLSVQSREFADKQGEQGLYLRAFLQQDMAFTNYYQVGMAKGMERDKKVSQ
jgi:hypothetical protein